MYGDPPEKNAPFESFTSKPLNVVESDTHQSDTYDLLLVICSNYLVPYGDVQRFRSKK